MSDNKFKVWDKCSKSFYDGDLGHLVIRLDGSIWLFNPDTERYECITHLCELIRCTGLKDYNNKGEELFEGDVVYVAGYGNYICEFPFAELYEALGEQDIGGKLGNIYENPELLEPDIKKVDCEGVGDNDGFFEINVPERKTLGETKHWGDS